MADFTAHYLFGHALLERCDIRVKALMEADLNAFNWGLQGPDPLLFHNGSLHNEEYNKYSALMHTVHTDRLLAAMAEYIGEKNDTALTAYFMGMVCHYALDRRIHPYVYYTQFQLEKADPRWKRSAHTLIECQLDKYYWGKLRTDNINHFKVRTAYQKDRRLFALLAEMYDMLLRQIYRVTPDKKILEKCFYEVIRYTPYFYSSTGIFYHGCKTADALFGWGGKAVTHVKRFEAPFDFSNEDHAPWFNLWHPEKTFYTSAWEIFNDALDESETLTQAVTTYFSDGVPLSPSLHLEIPFTDGCVQNDWYKMLTMY